MLPTTQKLSNTHPTSKQPMYTFDQLGNAKVKVTTLLDLAITGSIYACSSSQELLALRITNNTGKGTQIKPETYRIINTAFIKSIQVVAPLPKKNGKPSGPTPSYILIEEIEAALDSSVKKPKTPIASRIYSKLSEKLGSDNVKWKGNDIVLFGEIKASRPYTLAKGNLSQLTANSHHLEPVPKALKEIWLELDSEKRGG